MAADDIDQLGKNIFGGMLGAAGTIKWVMFGLLCAALLFAIIWKLKHTKKYIYKPEVWGIVGGVPDLMQMDKGRPISVRTKEGVNSLIYFKRLKRYLKIPNRLFFVGKKIRFWFRQDGELTPIKPIKVGIFDFKKGDLKENKANEIMEQARKNEDIFIPLMMEDVNEKFAVMGVKYVNEDARLSHVSTGKIIREMFSMNKFLKEHGATILMIMGIIALAFSVILILDATKSYQDSGAGVAESSGKIVDRMDKINMKTDLYIENLDKLIKENRGYQNVQCSPQTNSS